MWSAAFDASRQLLEIGFSERVDLAQARDCATQIRALLKSAAPGFCLLNDLTDLQEMETACGPVIDGMMDALNERGISKVIRVIPEPAKDIGFGIMSLFHYARNVRVITCETLEEARVHLPPAVG
jgi:hypothetical protein